MDDRELAWLRSLSAEARKFVQNSDAAEWWGEGCPAIHQYGCDVEPHEAHGLQTIDFPCIDKQGKLLGKPTPKMRRYGFWVAEEMKRSQTGVSSISGRKVRGGFVLDKDAAGRWRGVGAFVPKHQQRGLSIDRDVEIIPGTHALGQGLLHADTPFGAQPVVGLARWRFRSRETGTFQALVLLVDSHSGHNAATNVEEYLLGSGVEAISETTPEAYAMARAVYDANKAKDDERRREDVWPEGAR
jgi:hypothetical protein